MKNTANWRQELIKRVDETTSTMITLPKNTKLTIIRGENGSLKLQFFADLNDTHPILESPLSHEFLVVTDYRRE